MSTENNHQTHSPVANYPPPGDSTSEGGYTGDPFTRSNQRGTDTSTDTTINPDTGLIQQSLNGTPLSSEIQDAKQGDDRGSRRAFQERGEGGGPTQRSQNLNPYGRSIETDDEANANLVSQIKDTRARDY